MLTLALYGLLAIAIMAALFFVAANFLPAGEQIAPPVRDETPWQLPAARPLDASDVAAIRLPVALRGYRFAETDVLLDRLGEELRVRDAEIARLRGEATGSGRAAYRVADGAGDGAARDSAADRGSAAERETFGPAAERPDENPGENVNEHRDENGAPVEHDDD